MAGYVQCVSCACIVEVEFSLTGVSANCFLGTPSVFLPFSLLLTDRRFYMAMLIYSFSALLMVVKGYVLIQSQAGKARSVAKAMAKVRGVKMVHAVTGLYDVIVYLELPNMNSLSELVMQKIQPVKGVERTHAAIVL